MTDDTFRANAPSGSPMPRVAELTRLIGAEPPSRVARAMTAALPALKRLTTLVHAARAGSE